MTINLNDSKEFTVEKVRELIASEDDSKPRQIRVTLGGIAFFSDSTGAESPEGLAFRLRTFEPGKKELGKEAANNEDWVKRVHKAMRENWPNPLHTYVDTF